MPSIHRFLTSSLLALCAAAGPALAEPADAPIVQQAGQALDEHDYGQALALLRQAADQGNASAARSAGLMLLYGQRLYGAQVASDRALAQHYLGRAAALGCEVSRITLQQLDRRS